MDTDQALKLARSWKENDHLHGSAAADVCIALVEMIDLCVSMLDENFDAERDCRYYDQQAVNQVHRMLSGGKAPRETVTIHCTTDDDDVPF